MASWLLASTLSSLGTQWLLQRVQNIAWRGWFPSSQFGQINSPERKTLGTSISFFKLPLKFSDRRRKSKRSNSGKNRRQPPPGPSWAGRPGLAGRPTLSRGPGRSSFSCTALFRLLSPWEKVGPVNLCEKLQKIKRKTIYRNSCLVFRPRLDVRALLPWWRHQHGEGAQRRVRSKP
jgi:hypothetical protein